MESSRVEKDLRVLVDRQLSMSQQGIQVAKNVNSTLAYIRNNVASKRREVFGPLGPNLALVRLHPKYCVHFLEPSLQERQ